MVRPKKNLGQHFLTDPGIANRITDSLKLDRADTVLEVGPGKGILTRILKDRVGIKFYTVEIDQEAIRIPASHLSRPWRPP